MRSALMPISHLCGIALEDYIYSIEEFHGARSPGMLMGGMLLDRALNELGPTPYLNVVCETVVCLPDAVQLLTNCTIGNGYLQVLDWGKFALCAYDRTTLNGSRVWLDLNEIGKHQVIREWFQRTGKPRVKPPFEQIAEAFLNSGAGLVRSRAVKLHKALKDEAKVITGACPQCGESYPLRQGDRCLACQGQAYYR